LISPNRQIALQAPLASEGRAGKSPVGPWPTWAPHFGGELLFSKVNGMTVIGTAEKVVLALRGAPMLLTLLVINLAVLAMVTYLTVQAAEIRRSERAELIGALRECLAKRS
jgi:hypothetical protein